MSSLLQFFEFVAREKNLSVLLVHHVNKSSLSEDSGEADATRGASTLVDNPRFVGIVRGLHAGDKRYKHMSAEVRRSYTKYEVVKSNYSATWGDRWFQRNEEGVLIPCAEPVAVDDDFGGGRGDRY